MLVVPRAEIPIILSSSCDLECLAALGSGIFCLNVGRIARRYSVEAVGD